MRAAFYKFIRIYPLSFKQTQRGVSFILTCISVLLLLYLHDRPFPCIMSLSPSLVLPFAILHSITFTPITLSVISFHRSLSLSRALPRASYVPGVLIIDGTISEREQFKKRPENSKYLGAVLSCATSVYFYGKRKQTLVLIDSCSNI